MSNIFLGTLEIGNLKQYILSSRLSEENNKFQVILDYNIVWFHLANM